MSIIDWLFGGRKRQAQQSKPTSSHRPSREDYSTRCFEQRFPEEEETRMWNSDPAFRRVLDPLNAGDNPRAQKEAEVLSRSFGDFAELYVWWAKSLLNQRNYQEARKVLHEGLSRAKQKFPLLNLMGEVEWKAGSLSDAVCWWIQGLMGQQTREDFGGELGAYLYLHYVADALGLSSLASQLIARVDFIRPGRIRLSTDASGGLRALVGRSDTADIKKALAILEGRYFRASSGSEKPSSGDDEVPKLIRIALDEKAGYDARGKAIQRLAEVGDARAIAPLMQIYNHELHFIRLDAKDAVEKIRSRGNG